MKWTIKIRDAWNALPHRSILPAHIADRLRVPLYLAGALLAVLGIAATGVLPATVSLRGTLVGLAVLGTLVLIVLWLDRKGSEADAGSEGYTTTPPVATAAMEPFCTTVEPVRWPPASIGETIRLAQGDTVRIPYDGQVADVVYQERDGRIKVRQTSHLR